MDKFGKMDNSFTLKDSSGVVFLNYEVGSLKNEQSYTLEQCLPEDSCYTFTIEDEYGDGLCCEYGHGSYAIVYDGIEVAAGRDFGSLATHTFGKGC